MLKLLLLAPFLALAFTATAHAADFYVFFGTHNSGPSRGLSLAHFDTATGILTKPELAIHSDSSAYFVITPDGKFIYTANSVADFGGVPHMGAVSAFSLDVKTDPKNPKLTLLNQQPSAGEDPSYISLDHTGHFALIANYQGNRVPGQGGTVAVFALKPDGTLGDRTAFVQHAGTSVDPVRQKQAYAHSIVVDPTNKFAIVDDLGLDKVFIYKFDEKTGSLTPNDPPFAAVKPGSGPRHTTFAPDGKTTYIIHEMGSMITAFHWDSAKGTLTPFQEISTLPPGFKGTSTAAEIHIHPGGKFLYASNRGHDSLAEFSIDPDTAKLTLMATIPSAGKTPRNFEIDPTAQWIILTNQDSDNAVVFQIDPATGKLSQKGDPVAITYPFCPRFLAVP